MVTRLEHIPDSEEKLEEDNCTNCEILKLWLDQEIEAKNNLQNIIFVNARLIHSEDIEKASTQDFKPIHKNVPLRVRRAKKEFEQRQVAKQKQGQAIEVDSQKSAGEILFEEKLKEVH